MDQDFNNFKNKQFEFQKNSFVVIKNFFHKETLNFFQTFYLLVKAPHPSQVPIYERDIDFKTCIPFSSTPIGCSISLVIKDFVSYITEKNLSFSYDYSRCYLKGGVLKRHTDRESCEYSITMCVKKGSHDYPIYFESKEGNTVEIELEEGDFIIYEGTKLKHWRDEYQGDKHYQLFLHYVDKDGPNYIYKDDNLIKNIGNYL